MATITATYLATFIIGGDLIVNRLGYGAMRITGEGIWRPPADHGDSIRVCGGEWNWAWTSSTRLTATGPAYRKS